MNSYSDSSTQRLYRDADRAVLGGVCAGLAGYFGLNLKVTRFLAFVAFLMAMPVAIIAYLAGVLLIPAESHRHYESVIETRCCWGSSRRRRSRREWKKRASRASSEPTAASTGPSVKDVRKRYQSLDKRLAELEKQVTSPRFQLDQEFRRL